MLKKQYFLFFFFAWFCLIMVLSAIPDNSPDAIKINSESYRLDYLKHFLVYFPLGFCLLAINIKGNAAVFLIGVMAASIPEFMQYFLPYRTFNSIDLLFNAFGFVFGVVAFIIVNRKYELIN